MSFHSPIYLYLLLLIPVIIAVYFYSNYRRKSRIRRYGDAELLKSLMPSIAPVRSAVTFWLSLLAFALLVVALARPRYGTHKETVVTKGVEVVVALDVSNSMLAQDIYPNRLEKAKKLIMRMMSKIKGNKVSLIVFAGDAFIQLPATEDYVSANMIVNEIQTGLIKNQGTNVAAAIDLAMNSFSDNEKIGKAIVVITDGENHEEGAVEAAQAAAEKGVKLYVLGVGTTDGGRIPYVEDEIFGKYRKQNSGDKFLRDSKGENVITKLNETAAKEIAAAGNGSYIRVDDSSAAQDYIESELGKLAQDEVKSEVFTKFNEQFDIIGLMAFMLLIIDVVAIAIIDYVYYRKKSAGR
ncbi:MAG: VWA domain-containing protein [Bacteroidaceae bacterium]|nr:VWA domain-containing protein [Bacteroidaceae bacterium]